MVLKLNHFIVIMVFCGVLYEFRYDTLRMGIANQVGNTLVGWSNTQSDTASGTDSPPIPPGSLLSSVSSLSTPSNAAGSIEDVHGGVAFASLKTDLCIGSNVHRVHEFLSRFRSMSKDSPYAEAGITSKPGYFTPCYHPAKSQQYGLRGWRCSQSGKQNEGDKGNNASSATMMKDTSCLLNQKWVGKNYDSHKKSTASFHPQDVPCEAAQKEDPSCKCPVWREPEDKQRLRKWETSLGFGKKDLKFYPHYWRPNKTSIWDVDSAEPEAADSLIRKACDAAIRSSLPAAIKVLLAKGDWGEVLQNAKKNGFVETFLHTRAPYRLTRPKERFDWVLGGGGQRGCPLQGLVRAPTTVLMPAPWTDHGGNMHILDYALTSHTDVYTSMLNYDAEPGADGGGMPEWKPGDPFRVLVVAGSDHRVAERIRWIVSVLYMRYFHRILWEANNREFPGIHTAPIGFNHKYTNLHGTSTIMKILLNPTPLDKKNTSFLAAWGKVYSSLDKHITSRKRLIKWLEQTSIGGREDVAAHKWWSTVSKYRFQLCPTGNGVQAPKIQESWMSNVIPIVNNEPAFFELKKWGYPLVIVEHWDEITEEKMEQWWQELSPRLAVVKWMLLPDVWYAFVTQPCPITNIVDFLRRAGINEDVLTKGGGK